MAANIANVEKTPDRVFLWSHPRSMSTCFMRCIGDMDGVQLWQEPYCDCYLKFVEEYPDIYKIFPKTKLFFASGEEAAKTAPSLKEEHGWKNMSSSELYTLDWVKEQLSKPLEKGKKIMFIKDASFGIDGHYDKLPTVPARHTFIIRNPNRAALSFWKVMKPLVDHEGADPNDFDAGSGHPYIQWEHLPSRDGLLSLWNYVRENLDPNPIVIDADDVRNHPEEMISKYCQAIGIPFKKEYLKWDQGYGYYKHLYGSLETRVWAMTTDFYKTAFSTTCFLPSPEKVPTELPTGAENYAEMHREGYKIMYEHRIKPKKN